MPPTTPDVPMTDPQFLCLAGIIHERSGIRLAPAKKHVLESRLGARLGELGLDDYDQYATFLTIGPYRDDEFQEMFGRIAVNENSFFRNQPQLELFEKRLLARLIESRSARKRLRIWSVACSTGEEPYTLAILAHRTLGVRLPDWRVEVLGTDLSEKALETARAARYGASSLAAVGPLNRRRYFHQEGETYHVATSIRSMVAFETQNLKDRLAARRHGAWDAIFCRNLLSELDDATHRDALALFDEQLAEDGCLLIGHNETLRDSDGRFEPLPVPRAFAYRRADAHATPPE
ncbi:MAG: hypothetical protein JNM07_09435 [Phycisphaerae bacterium]|nr:hypothetical protein [Phycisphaerae bacterium]